MSTSRRGFLGGLAATLALAASGAKVIVPTLPAPAPPPRLVASDGWLLCDGQAVSRAAYPELFALMDTRFGLDVGKDEFKLPDLRGIFWAMRPDRTLDGSEPKLVYGVSSRPMNPFLLGDEKVYAQPVGMFSMFVVPA